jgi:hypothetical protein
MQEEERTIARNHQQQNQKRPSIKCNTKSVSLLSHTSGGAFAVLTSMSTATWLCSAADVLPLISASRSSMAAVSLSLRCPRNAASAWCFLCFLAFFTGLLRAREHGERTRRGSYPQGTCTHSINMKPSRNRPMKKKKDGNRVQSQIPPSFSIPPPLLLLPLTLRTPGAYSFLTIWTMSSSASTWSLPTFCGWCLQDEPQTQAYLKSRSRFLWIRKQKSSIVGLCECKMTGAE